MLRGPSFLATQLPIGSRKVVSAIRPSTKQFINQKPIIIISAPRRYKGDTSSASTQQNPPSTAKTYHGACHCGSIRVHLHTHKTPSQLGSRACQCSYCRLHGASFTSDAEGTLSIKASGAMNPYRMGTGTAEFLTCANCGVIPAATWKRDDGKLLSVVRVQCLDIRDELEKHEKRWSVEHELDNLEERFSRRSRTWTPTKIEK